MSLSEVHQALVPGAREILKRGLTLNEGKNALTVAAISVALEEENNQKRAARRLGLTAPNVNQIVHREESLARFRKKQDEQK